MWKIFGLVANEMNYQLDFAAVFRGDDFLVVFSNRRGIGLAQKKCGGAWVGMVCGAGAG